MLDVDSHFISQQAHGATHSRPLPPGMLAPYLPLQQATLRNLPPHCGPQASAEGHQRVAHQQPYRKGAGSHVAAPAVGAAHAGPTGSNPTTPVFAAAATSAMAVEPLSHMAPG